MTIDATAQALVADEAMPQAADTDPTEANTEPSEDDIYSEAFDRLNGDGVDDDEPDADEKAEEGADGETADQPKDDADQDEGEGEGEPVPTDMPAVLKDKWKDIPEDARKGLTDWVRTQNEKATQLGREVSAIKPIRDSLVEMATEFPALHQMTPQQVMREMGELARVSQAFNDNPVNALMGLVQQHGLQEALSAALQGQQPGQSAQHVTALQNEIRQLKGQLERVGDPQALRSQFESWQTETSTVKSVQEFAGQAEHWAQVEDQMPRYIKAVQAIADDGTPPGQILSDAYEMAVQKHGLAKAKAVPAGDEPALQPDPERAKAAMKAKSVNVNGGKTGKQRELTEDEILSQTYDRLTKS